MIKIILSFFILFLGFCVQMIFAPYLALQGIKWDLLMVLVVYFSLVYGWKIGLILGIIGGILQDSFSLGKTGLFTLSITGSCVGAFHKAIFTDNFIAKMIVFFLVCILYFFMSFFILRILSYTYSGFVGELFLTYLGYNSVLALIVFFCLEKVYK